MSEETIRKVIPLMMKAYKAGALDVTEGTLLEVSNINDHVIKLLKKILIEEVPC